MEKPLKLVLKKETIARLAQADLSHIVGGDSGPGGGNGTKKNCGDGEDQGFTQGNCLTVTCG
jgi:hypothetical protein